MTAVFLCGLLVALAAVPRLGPGGRRPAGAPTSLLPGAAERISSLRVAWSGRTRAARERAVEALPALLEQTARSRRAGLTLLPSLEAAARAVPETGMGSAAGRIRAGQSLAAALDDWAGGLAHPDAGLTVAVLLLGDASGAAVAARLDATAAALRQRAALADEVKALTAQARTSAMVIALAPVVFGAVVAAADARYVRSMFATGIGRLALASGLVLDLVAIAWMRRLTSIEP